jgi:caffeoyl-CoA O-methyltransferase
MTQTQWTAIDDYIASLLIPADPSLDATLQSTVDGELPLINVAPNQGKLLQILALTLNARRILEIGTLAGYSTIWLARALPADGKLITLEFSPKHAAVAQENINRAGLSDRIELRQGAALDTLPQLVAEGQEPFDLVFIDADKVNTAEYFSWALKLTRKGSLIITDNVIRKGAVINSNSDDPNVQGIRRFNELLAEETRVTATIIQTVGSKGHDGLAIALVTADSTTS